MTTEEFVLASLAGGGGKSYSPVQVQKFLFLLDKNIPEAFGGTHFEFEPYDYGPFDKNVYSVLDGLEEEGFVNIIPTGRGWNKYTLTPAGLEKGQNLLPPIDDSMRLYAEKVAEFVTTVSFSELVSAIYAQYPEMKVNSVFNS